ncbi:type IV secretory system conjugative DNA transfer family protein [Nocardia sp. alder85J]|uniref:type IV secretory system conjugative DNA transfer family protein n=1 Tax=Nocardia sp. alder85J TaxID=2862949 RepID=UPI001CD509D6|nr:type IV secretory system conjugative DNA transfer family protein [Nocardia sp. alder85J]MCX4099217.1 TraM recognition domain-containing protein [Nocardia sp. alder85J]
MDRRVSMPGADQPGEYREAIGIAAVTLGTPALVEVAGAALWTAPAFGGPRQSIPFSNPVGLGWELFSTHELVWTPAAWAGLVTDIGVTAAGVAGTVAGVTWACRRCRTARAARGRTADEQKQKQAAPVRTLQRAPKALPQLPIDAQAQFLARDIELADLMFEAVAAKAARLGVARGAMNAPGVSIGETLGRRQVRPEMLYGSFEDLHLAIMGPRAGKSSSYVIPALMESWGPAIATSNKRDIVDATREYRAGLGDVWVFDPQQVAGETCDWFWDPIAWVTGTDGGADAQERAAKLAGHFAAGGDERKDAFFDGEGEELVAGLILAASVAKKPITQCFLWVTDPGEDEPIEILHQNYPMVAAALRDQYTAPDRQRSGIFSTAKKMMACLKYQKIRPWVCPPEDGDAQRIPFDVRAFVRSRDTLYPLSREGAGTAGPLITALTAAVAAAAEDEGVRCGGRMPVPLTIALDEAANIVRWTELPKQYSHFGSRGIVVLTILQSWAQGVRCWGEDGMRALWSAANIRTLGPGLADAPFLRDISDVVGGHYELVSSLSRSKGTGKDSRSTSTSWSRTTEVTLTPSDLAAMPPGRALVLASGHRPALVRLVPWWDRDYADQVTASLDRHDPARNQHSSQADGWSAPSTSDGEDDDE